MTHRDLSLIHIYLCAGGWGDLVLLCPLGALGSMIAQHTIIPQALVSLGLAAVALLLFGRFFCSWVCPTPALQKVLPNRGERKLKESSCAGSCASCNAGCGKSKGVKDVYKRQADPSPDPDGSFP